MDERRTYINGNGSRNPYITPVNITFVVINVIAFFVSDVVAKFSGADTVTAAGAMFPPAVLYGQWYRLITCTFLHSDIGHLFNNMIVLVCLGSYLERSFGRIKYIIFYLATGFASSLISMAWMLRSADLAWSIGASGIVFGVIGALLWIIIRNKGRFRDLSITRFVIMIILSLCFGFTSVGVDNAAHVGGLLVGFVLGALLYRKNVMEY